MFLWLCKWKRRLIICVTELIKIHISNFTLSDTERKSQSFNLMSVALHVCIKQSRGQDVHDEDKNVSFFVSGSKLCKWDEMPMSLL